MAKNTSNQQNSKKQTLEEKIIERHLTRDALWASGAWRKGEPRARFAFQVLGHVFSILVLPTQRPGGTAEYLASWKRQPQRLVPVAMMECVVNRILYFRGLCLISTQFILKWQRWSIFPNAFVECWINLTYLVVAVVQHLDNSGKEVSNASLVKF